MSIVYIKLLEEQVSLYFLILLKNFHIQLSYILTSYLHHHIFIFIISFYTVATPMQ